MQELTGEKNKIVSALSKSVFPTGSNNHSNELPIGLDGAGSMTTAMLFAAVDTKIKWNPGFEDKQNNLVRKIMIPMIYRDFIKILETPGDRTRPKADGTDSCATATIPDPEQLNEVLFDNQFTVVSSFIRRKSDYSEYNEKLCAELFSRLLVPYYEAPVPKAGQFVDKPENFDAKAYAKILYDIISKEVMTCDWEDPVGYNTLGL